MNCFFFNSNLSFHPCQSCARIMEKADDILPLASSYGGKLFHVVRSSFVDSLEACLKNYLSRQSQVCRCGYCDKFCDWWIKLSARNMIG